MLGRDNPPTPPYSVCEEMRGQWPNDKSKQQTSMHPAYNLTDYGYA